MTQPLNPAIPKGTLSLPPKVNPNPPPVYDVAGKAGYDPGRKKQATLTMPQNFQLIEWLKSYKMQPGDTLETLAIAAAATLKIPQINKDHIQKRCQEFNIALPRRIPSTPTMERISKLESVLRLVIRDHAKALRDLGFEPAAEVLQFLDEA